jgi:hypothetical protein
MKLNENTVESLPKPASGNRVHYFPEAIVQGEHRAASAFASPRRACEAS